MLVLIQHPGGSSQRSTDLGDTSKTPWADLAALLQSAAVAKAAAPQSPVVTSITPVGKEAEIPMYFPAGQKVTPSLHAAMHASPARQ
jgi:hypothetical protein